MESVSRAFAPGGDLERLLSGYEHRPQQGTMAESVARAFEAGRHLLVEAGTGVGKSYAYLWSACEQAAAGAGPVLISTHTISLQSQLFERDIPALLDVGGWRLEVVLAKGRGNYVSRRRLALEIADATGLFGAPGPGDPLGRLGAWVRRGADGSRQDLDFEAPFEVWDRVR